MNNQEIAPSLTVEDTFYYRTLLDRRVKFLRKAIIMPGSYCECEQYKNHSCKQPGKHPVAKLETASSDPSRVDFRRSLALCGADSGIFVLDQDSKEAREWCKEQGFLTNTLEVTTSDPNKIHTYYLYPDFEVNNSQSQLFKGVDIRGHHGMAVAPGAVHENGRVYKCSNAVDLAPAPEPLLDALKNATTAKSSYGGFNHRSADKHESGLQAKEDLDYSKSESWWTLLHLKRHPEIPEGQRNKTIFDIASSMRYRGFSEEQILNSISYINDLACTPSLSYSELENIVSNVCERYDNKFQPTTIETYLLLDRFMEYFDSLEINGIGDCTDIQHMKELVNEGRTKSLLLSDGIAIPCAFTTREILLGIRKITVVKSQNRCISKGWIEKVKTSNLDRQWVSSLPSRLRITNSLILQFSALEGESVKGEDHRTILDNITYTGGSMDRSVYTYSLRDLHNIRYRANHLGKRKAEILFKTLRDGVQPSRKNFKDFGFKNQRSFDYHFKGTKPNDYRDGLVGMGLFEDNRGTYELVDNYVEVLYQLYEYSDQPKKEKKHLAEIKRRREIYYQIIQPEMVETAAKYEEENYLFLKLARPPTRA